MSTRPILGGESNTPIRPNEFSKTGTFASIACIITAIVLTLIAVFATRPHEDGRKVSFGFAIGTATLGAYGAGKYHFLARLRDWLC